MQSDIEIARGASLKNINEIAKLINIPNDALHNYGRHIAKIDFEYLQNLETNPNSKLILVTAISPTPAGEGKTTTTIGLGDAINALGKKTMIALREPSLGPCFGQKGGAAGGGYSQVVPMEQINLHFTGDFHAITTANNLLAAMIDNHIYWGNELEIDTRRIVWRRALDMNDRALRNINVGLGGINGGFAREDGFDISVASEIMAIFCLAKDLSDLETRIGNIIIAYKRDKTPIYARDIHAHGALSVLLKDAIAPNLVQTLENTPALIHGGPFANIAHGCNSLIATNAALKLADYVVTEAGFGADLGAEKFLDIKCRIGGLKPSIVVIVATIRALKMHGGVDKKDLGHEDIESLKKGVANLERHIKNIRKFGLDCIVAINRFFQDTENEIAALQDICTNQLNAESFICSHFSDGSKGTIDLAKAVIEATQKPSNYAPLYDTKLPINEKIEKIAKEIYGAKDINFSDKAKQKMEEYTKLGYADTPICIAKTQYSFSADPKKMGAPKDFTLPINDLRLSAGAGFVVALCGDIMTMPGLPRIPAANSIGLNDKGQIEGLF